MPLNLRTEPIQPFSILALDPGGTTGYAHAALLGSSIDNSRLEGRDVSLDDILVMTGEFGPTEHHEELYHFINTLALPGLGSKLEVVSEPFHYRQNVVEEGEKFRGKVELISAEYIGVIKLACAQLGLQYYDRFTPGEAKRYCPNRKLELLGWLQTPITPMRHRNDALRQLVKYLIVKRGVRHPLTTAWRIEE